MFLTKLSIENFKSFFKTETFEFAPGFNVLLGANSSGKTSVLEAIEIAKLVDKPHRSIHNISEPTTNWREASLVKVSLALSSAELKKALAPDKHAWIAVGPTPYSQPTYDLDKLNVYVKHNYFLLDLLNRAGRGEESGRLRLKELDAVWRPFRGNSNFAAARLDFDSEKFTNIQQENLAAGDIERLSKNVSARTYRFSADRKVSSVSGHHENGVLLNNAENLAYCINWLQSTNPNLFRTLNSLVHRIFPTVHWVSAIPDGGNIFRLKIHTVPIERDRGDLAVSIDQVGTGVFNAIAILYVALTATDQQIILLEEPNSFLHPRAIRELLAILSDVGGKHQFFVSTHSSDVLRTIKASTVTLLEYDGSITTRKQVVGEKLSELRAGLIDLGIRLTDLHGCDFVLWVEGETEEAVFPMILARFFPERAQGVAVLRIHATGDFEAKRFSPEKVAEIYRKLSQGSFLAPPMLAIILDREDKQKTHIDQIEKDCAGIVRFLPKTMFEDYLLNANAIGCLLSEITNRNISVEDSTRALALAQANSENRLKPRNTKSTEAHAAKLLSDVFQKLGGPGVEYHKTNHGPKLAEWILGNSPDDFIELKGWLADILKIET